MAFGLDNLGILFGLVALAVPILLHLLQRRRHDTLDWGAMQFLPASISAHRKRWVDEILLMLMRMAMIALIVIALATPFSTSARLASLGDQSARDIVVILDGSYSMDVRVPNQPTPWEEAMRWLRNSAPLPPGEEGPGVRGQSLHESTILIARQPALFWHGNLDELAALTPRGNPDMPAALAEAWKHLQRSKAPTKEIIVLTDRQLHGWVDLETLAALDNLGSHWQADAQQAKIDGLAVPSLRVVQVGAPLANPLANYSLAPLHASRGMVRPGQKITFRTDLHLYGFNGYEPPRSVKVLIDAKEAQNLPLPQASELKQGQIPLSFPLRFDREGRYVVSLILDADPAYDVLKGDNEQQVVVEVVKELPILLVDGDRQLSANSSSFFLQRALAAKHAVPQSSLKASAIFPGAADAVKPAVIVLADVPRLEPAQIEALDRFLAEGGGLLIIAGERVAAEKAFYNQQLYRHGQGWLPAQLEKIGSSRDGMQPELRTFQHPALELFRASTDATMNQVRFPKWWKVSLNPTDRTTIIGKLSNSDPFLLEKTYEKGRVILCTVPPDRRWNSTLPGAWEYPILMHQLVEYLASSRHVAGVLKQAAPDLRESNLTRCSDDDWRKVRERLPIVWHSEEVPSQSIEEQDGQRQELWWLLLLAVLGLLCSEVWMTRRMALARGR